MDIDRAEIELRVLREPYDEKEPDKQRKSMVFLTHKPTGIVVREIHVSQAKAYVLALGKLKELLHK